MEAEIEAETEHLKGSHTNFVSHAQFRLAYVVKQNRPATIYKWLIVNYSSESNMIYRITLIIGKMGTV